MSDLIQSRLLRWAACFLFVFSVILTISPAGRERTWAVDYKFSHWLAYLIWLLFISIAHIATRRLLHDHDPFLFPAAALLSGWGLLTIWRLDQSFGIRQMIWFGLGMTVFIVAMRLPHNLFYLRRYKYILLSSGLVLTAFTLIFGTNPLGFGPRLWLGCCGVYFQPSEPLKLLLVIYLAAYLADRYLIRLTAISLLAPTITLTGIALLLLLVQRDLGTASIFIFIFTSILFIVSGKKRVLFGSVILLTGGLLIGYFYIDIIHTRVDSWLNPWNDPSGRSYQIVQSLLAIANGGITGRGAGLGNPLLVPVAISDFIYAAIAEETGLAGTVGLLATIWLILARGIVTALRAADRFRRFLAAGIVSYLGIQSLLIIGGNLRLLPLTGVTLPFVSYGGSSLLTSFVAVIILLIISSSEDREPVVLLDPKPYTLLVTIMGLGLAGSALASAWWTIARGPELLDRTDNARRAIADRYVPRGDIVDRSNRPINVTEGESGSYTRNYVYPDLAPIIGYTHPVFGQAGVEASLDPYLRGLQGNPASLIWWDHLLYGTPPPGLDVRLSIDLNLQAHADRLLAGHQGAIILMNAQTGEILVMASHPTFDPNKLDDIGAGLSQDTSSPLVNRATQGLFPIDSILLPLIQGRFGSIEPDDENLLVFYESLGLDQPPDINMPVAYENNNVDPGNFRASPLQVITTASALSNHGMLPSPRIAMAVNTLDQGWVVLPVRGTTAEILPPKAADEAALSYLVEGKPYWRHVDQYNAEEANITWLIAGTLPDWGGTPLALAIVLEETNPSLAIDIHEKLLAEAIK